MEKDLSGCLGTEVFTKFSEPVYDQRCQNQSSTHDEMREPFPGPVPTKAIPQVCNSVTHTPQVPVTGCLLSREPIFLYHVITNITCIFKLQKQIGLNVFLLLLNTQS